MLEKVINVIDEYLSLDNIDDVGIVTSLADDLGMDDMDKAEIMVALEEAFDISLSESEVMSWKTVGDIVNYLQAEL